MAQALSIASVVLSGWLSADNITGGTTAVTTGGSGRLQHWLTVDRLPRGVSATVSERGQGGHRYALTRAGRAAFCYAHGGRPADLGRRTKMGRLRAVVKGVETDIWPYRPEAGAYETLGQFREMGCTIAPGWRARVALADGTRIDPDGMVLVEPPWGRLWCFFEFEPSDRSYKAVEPRVEKYASEHRRDTHPVLFVCHDDRAEANFHAAGVECGRLPQMLTTTLRRLRDAGVAGTGVWLYYGLPRTLASLALSGRSLFLLVISSIASSSLSRQEASRHQNRLCIPGTGENHGAQPFGPPLLEIPYLKTQVTWV